MKKILEFSLIMLFLLQGSNIFNIVILLLLFLLTGSLLLRKNLRFTFPKYLIVGVIIYFLFLVIGILYQHPDSTRDIKFQFFFLLFYYWLISTQYNINLLRLMLVINIIVFGIYLLLLAGIFPNIWREDTFGFMGRLYGPSIIAPVLIGFYYLYFKKAFDRQYAIAMAMGVSYIALTTNFMNLLIVVVLTAILVTNFRKLLQPVYIISISVFLTISVAILYSPYMPELVKVKLEYVSKPHKYPSFQIRIQDLKQVINNEDFNTQEKLFGRGFGTRSVVYRDIPWRQDVTVAFQFQEIDNGFYYLYHRGGWTLLLLVIMAHIWLLVKIKNLKAKAGFLTIFVITNLLTIHYFNHMFYLILPYTIIYGNKLTGGFNKLSEERNE